MQEAVVLLGSVMQIMGHIHMEVVALELWYLVEPLTVGM